MPINTLSYFLYLLTQKLFPTFSSQLWSTSRSDTFLFVFVQNCFSSIMVAGCLANSAAHTANKHQKAFCLLWIITKEIVRVSISKVFFHFASSWYSSYCYSRHVCYFTIKDSWEQSYASPFLFVAIISSLMLCWNIIYSNVGRLFCTPAPPKFTKKLAVDSFFNFRSWSKQK